MVFVQEGAGVLPVNETVVDAPLMEVPAGSTNGTPLEGRVKGSRGVIFYLASGDSITYGISDEAPESAPVTLIVDEDDKVAYEPLGPGTNVYVTAKTGNPLYRWL